jgi:dUTPase
MTVSYRCDRCGRSSEQRLVVISVGIIDRDYYTDHIAVSKEVCQRCARELSGKFERFAGGSN